MELYKLFWVGTFVTLICMSVSCSVVSTSETSKKNETLARLVDQGVDPKAAACAVAISNGGGTHDMKLYCAMQ